MKPVKIMGFDDTSGRPSSWGLYEGATEELSTHGDFWSLEKDLAMKWLEGLDIVWGVETFYQDQFNAWAREAGVATVQHCNPEFYRFEMEPELPRPTITCVPTTWRLEHMPGVEVLPTPVAIDRLVWRERPLQGDDLTFLHVVGRKAAEDRNGTDALIEALPLVQEPCALVLTQQSTEDFVRPGLHGVVDVILQSQVPDYWRLYEDADVLVMPRRWGGQCLPIQEARACGLAVLTTEVKPQADWLPGLQSAIGGRARRTFHTQAGDIPIFDPNPVSIAKRMDYLSNESGYIQQASRDARIWSEAMSWDTWLPHYERTLVRAYERLHTR